MAILQLTLQLILGVKVCVAFLYMVVLLLVRVVLLGGHRSQRLRKGKGKVKSSSTHWWPFLKNVRRAGSSQCEITVLRPRWMI